MLFGIFLQHAALVNAEGNINRFAVVWQLSVKGGSFNEKFKTHIRNQSNWTLKAWKKGIIENVYMNTNRLNKGQKTNLVFFIKAKSKQEARIILNITPFAKNKVASYKLFEVGTLWLGVNKD